MNHFLKKLDFKISKTKFLFFLILASVSLQAQNTWYVNDTSTIGDVFTTAVGSDTNTGSKTSPFLTLEKAINSAASGDTIIIDAGTFNDKNLSINKAGLTIIGAGITKTVFDNNFAGASQNAFAVISASNVTLKNFYVTKYNYSVGGGRGKAITVMGATVTGVELDGMLLDNNGSSGGNGAFMVSGGAKATIKNGADSCNLPTGLFGGGIDVDGVGSEIIVHNQYISKNARGGGNGGAINITRGAKATVSNTVFDDNTAINGGAIFVNGTLIVTNSIFKNNVAHQTSSTAEGGAIAIGRRSTVTISNTQFISNVAGLVASTTGRGGAISINTGLGATYTGSPAVATLNLNNVSFTNNTATSTGRHIYGDEASSNQAEVTINNASFSGTTGAASTDIAQRTITEIVFSISNSGNPSKTNIAAAQQLDTNEPTGFADPTVPNPSGSCATFSCDADSFFPVITECVPNKTLSPINCEALLPDYTSEVVASDDCTLTISQSPAAGTSLPTGVNTVTISVTDVSGNTVTCSFTVTVAEQEAKNPGTNGTLVICSGTSVTSSQLFAQLGGSPSTGGSWSPSLAGAGTYTYSVNNCSNVLTATVTVTEQAAPNAGNDGTLAICAGTSVIESQLFESLNGNPSAGGIWSPIPSGAGTYTYTVAATSPCVVDATATITVTELTITAPSITSPQTFFCEGSSVVLTATGCMGQVVWSNGATGPELTVNLPGTYTAICSSNGCESVVSNSLIIEEKPIPTIKINDGAANITACEGQTIRLTASGGTQYSWSNGMITPFIDVIATNGSYTLIGKDANGCENEATIEIITNPLPTIVITGDDSFCANSSTTLTASGAASYLWNTGATTANITVNSAGTYTVVGTDANGCKSSKSITVATFSCPPPCPPNGNLLLNGSFELPQINLNFSVVQQENWTNLVDNGGIETWRNGFLNVPPVDGNQIIELNAHQLGTIIQNVTVETGVPINISYHHRSRLFSDQRIRMEIRNVATSQVIHSFTSTSNLTWQKFSTTFTTSTPNIQVRLISLSSCPGNAGCGNLVDLVVLNYSSCLCTSVPESPTINSTTTEVSESTSATLTASGCSNGTIKWSNGETGSSITTNVPGEYFAQCIDNDCESAPSNRITLTAISDASVTCPTFEWRSNGVLHVNYCVINSGSAPISGTTYVKVGGEEVFSDNYTNLLPGASVCFTYRKRFIPCGSTFSATVGTTMIGTDSDTSNNECSGSMIMNCVQNPPPYDPNFKDVEPKRNLEGGIFTTDDWLTYTVQCQNDGLGRAVNVVMLDKIDISKLDISTIELVSSTHPVDMVIHSPDLVGFEFHNIQLANSALDLLGSRAQIRFKIKRLPNQPVGTIIENQVGIFFDNEPEVKTNVIASKVIEPCDEATIETGVVSDNQTIEIGSIPTTFTLSSYQGIITGWEVATDVNFPDNETTKHNVYTNSFNIPTAPTETVYVRALVQPSGCQIAPSSHAKVVVTAPLNVSVNAPAITCNGLTTDAEFTITGGTSPYTINPLGTNLSAGDHVFTITDANGFSKNAAITITEPAAFTTSIASSNGNSFCFGETTILTASNGVSYLWSNGETTASISANISGTYSVIVTNKNGCKANASIAIDANYCKPVCPTKDNLIQNGSFENPSRGGFYGFLQMPFWTNAADGNRIEIQGPNLFCIGCWIPAPHGIQYIELNGNERGNIHQDVMVLPNKSLDLSFMHRARVRVAGAEILRVTLSDPTNNSNIYSFDVVAVHGEWKKITQNYVTGPSQTSVRLRLETIASLYPGSGNFLDNVILNYTDCGENKIAITGEDNLCKENSSTLTVTNTTEAVSFLWSNGATTPSITITQAGSYFVKVTFENGTTSVTAPFNVANCNLNKNIVVGEKQNEIVFNPLDEVLNFNVILYPNPTTDSFSIKLHSDSDHKVEISIYDILGKNIFNKTLNKDQLSSITIKDNLPSGIYTVIVKQGDKSKSVRLLKK